MKTARFQVARVPASRPFVCFRCEGPLVEGERCVRAYANTTARSFAAVARWLDPRDSSAWYHMNCALDVNLSELAYMLRNAPNDEELDALRERVKVRSKAVNATVRARNGRTFKSTSVEASEATCDPSGRPRVTVAYFGSMASAYESQPVPLRDFARDDTIRTARREYVFEEFAGSDTTHLACDPSRPLVGAVFGVLAGTRLVKQQRDKLALLRAFGVRTPVLWLCGPELADPVFRDAKVLELREALDAVGFAGDEAVAVCAVENSAAALDDIARALDDLDSEVAAPLRLDERFERAIVALEAALADRADHRLSALIEAIPAEISRDSALRARTFEALARCLAFASGRGAALLRMQRWGVGDARPAVLAMIRSALVEPGRTLSSDLPMAYALLGTPVDPELWEAWASAIEHDANKFMGRFHEIRARLAPCDVASIGERISTWSASLKKSDKRKVSAQELGAMIERRAR